MAFRVGWGIQVPLPPSSAVEGAMLGKPVSASTGPHCLAPVQAAAHTGVLCHPDDGGRRRLGFCGRRG